MDASFAQLSLGTQPNQYHTINISGNAHAILGNVAAGPESYRPGSHVDFRTTLKALYFEGMRTRKAQIDARASSPEHIGWVWDTNFAAWLNSEESFFWITGSAGSGKSTLMKHIADSRKTKQHLQRSGKQWAVIHFFFDFRAGSALSNNLEGMLRSLLYQLLKQCPGMATDVDLMSQEEFLSLNLSSCLDYLCDAANAASCRVCAFIDGLDEFDGSGADLVEVICSLEDRAGFKLCLASRPYQIFKSSFSRYSNLVVQDFNTESIKMYAQAQWAGKRLGVQPNLPKSFSDKIIEKARGIFLWARLAIDELLQDLLLGKTISALEAQLEEMPKEVEAMYQRVLDRTPEIMLREVAILLYLIVCSNSPQVSIQNLYIALEAHAPKNSGDPAASILPIDLDDEEGLEARILNALGDFIDIGTFNGSLHFIHESANPEDIDHAPFVVIHKGQLAIRRGPSACVSLTHETLRTFVRSNAWLESHIPVGLRSHSFHNVWLAVYLSGMENTTSCQSNILDLNSTAIRRFGEKIYSLFWDRQWGNIDAMSEDLLNILRHWPMWTPLLLCGVQELLREIARSKPVDEEILKRANAMLSTHVMRYHVPICLFQSCTASALLPGARDENFLFPPDVCRDQCSYSLPMRIWDDLNSIGWDDLLSICHGLPELSLHNSRLLTHPNSQGRIQGLFDRFWRKAMIDISGDGAYHSLLSHLLAHGAQPGGPHICTLFRRQVIDPALLALLSFVPNDIKLYHAQDCCLRGSEGQSSSFWQHWIEIHNQSFDSSESMNQATKLEMSFELLLRCGEQINARFNDEPILNSILEYNVDMRSTFERTSRMRKVLIALKAGADPEATGQSGNALQAVEKQLADLRDPQHGQSSSRLRSLILEYYDAFEKSSLLKNTRTETTKIAEMLRKYIEQGSLTQSQYEEYESCDYVKLRRYNPWEPFPEMDPSKLFNIDED